MSKKKKRRRKQIAARAKAFRPITPKPITPLTKRLARREARFQTPPSVRRRAAVQRRLPANVLYCVKYTRPKRQYRRTTAKKWGEFTTTGIHTSRCFDDIDQSIAWLVKLQEAGKCEKFCAIYERVGDGERMFWPRAAKHWKSLY
ncbi:MAG: hypothetical protein JSV86_10335 [Gemmatimonadota bacterium]|nr:MAG: hypothetical protein JSV86_10335 [Gemmatimonadota bacterium]